MPGKRIAHDLKPVIFQAAALGALQQAVEAYLIKLSIYWEDEALAWSGNALQIMSLQLARTSRPAPFVLIVNDVDTVHILMGNRNIIKLECLYIGGKVIGSLVEANLKEYIWTVFEEGKNTINML